MATPESHGVPAEVERFSWGVTGTFHDPDGNVCQPKDALDPFLATSGAGLSDAWFMRAVSFQSSAWFSEKSTMTYVEGYLISGHRDQKEGYSAFSDKVATVYRDHGALRIIDHWMNEAPQGSGTIRAKGAHAALDKTSETSLDVRSIADAGPNEEVMMSWVEWPDEAARDAGAALALADPRLHLSDDWVIFEGRRPISGSFMMILDT